VGADRVRAALLAGALATLGLACGASEADATRGFAERVLELRAAAEAAEARGEDDVALATFRAGLALPEPARVDAVVALRQELHFDVGRLLLLAGDASGAREHAALGLALGGDDSLFTANLHALDAMAAEALGDPPGAVAAYQRAIAVHERLFERALARDPPTTSPETP